MKMTWDDWKAYEQAKRGDNKHVPVGKKPTIKFEYEEQSGEMIHCGNVDQVEH
jgi:hypothetical protein